MATGKLASVSIGRKLRDLRIRYGAKSTYEMSQLMGGAYSPVVISRRETGKIRIDFAYLDVFFKALKVNDRDREKILRSTRVDLLKSEGKTAEMFSEYWSLMDISKDIRLYTASSIPPGLQTPAYSNAIFEASGIEAGEVVAITERKLQWGRNSMADNSKRVRLACSENALYTPMGNLKIMSEQLLYLRDAEEVPSFEFRILPNTVFLNLVIDELFGIFEQAFCFCENQLGLLTSEEPPVAARFSNAFESIWTNSAIGVRRNKMIDKALLHYRAAYPKDVR